MPPSNVPYPQPNRNRAAAVITSSVLVAVFLLIGLSCMWFGLQRGFGLPPTPTVTPTQAPAKSPTADVRATHVAEDMLTQVAFAATSLAQIAPGLAAQPGTPAGGTGGESPAQTQTPVIQLPVVILPGETAVPVTEQPDTSETPAIVAGGPTTVYIPNVSYAPPPTDTPVPTATFPQPFVPPTPITPVFVPPTATPTPFVPTPAPLPPTATPTQIAVAELAANIRAADTAIFVGPSAVYTQTGVMAANTTIRLRGRTQTGDWVVGCCYNGQIFWVRTAYVTIANNPLPSGAPQDADPNDPKWLAVYPPDPALEPRPVPTAIPPGDFPLARYNPQNTGRVPELPRPPMQNGWSILTQAAQPFLSPVAVMGSNVLASSLDGQFYSLLREVGNQRWRYNLGAATELAPAVQDNLVFIPYGQTQAAALQDQGNQAGLIWNVELPGIATSPFMIWTDTLFIGTGDGADARLLAMRRANPNDRREFNEPGSRVQLPAIGQELIYVGADRLWAVDINFWKGIEVVWISPDVFGVVAPPVYVAPGVRKLAELYVADQSGKVFALDANTGARIWVHDFGGRITALAVNDSMLYIAGGGVLRALSRQTGQALWTQATNGEVKGGPLVTNDRVLAVTQGGAVYLFEALTGAIVDANSALPTSVNGGPAVSREWLFIPASDNNVYSFRGTGQ